MGIGGPGPMHTAKAFAAPRVTRDLLREWGEAVWTASDLVEREFRNRLESSALRGLILGRI